MNGNNEMVEAIEDGKIVRVSRSYAITEGLLILKRQDLPKAVSQDDAPTPYVRYRPEKKFVDLDKFRRPLKVNDEITASLIDNFGWIIISKRKERSISRKQLADAIHADEEDVKMMELGKMPKNDYVLVNKLENYLGVMLRKDSNSGRLNLEPKEHRESRFLKEQKGRADSEKKESHFDTSGDDIQIIDEVD